MRVRSLQTYLANQKLVNTSPISQLRGCRIGVDAIYWLRAQTSLKDPLADAIGGLPPSVYGALDATLALHEKYGISVVFVFQGMQPRSHMLFSAQLHQRMDEAWSRVSEGHYNAAQHKFAQATSRINSDFVHVVSNYLLSKNCEVFQAPYFAASQLAYFTQEKFLDAVFGPPALFLFGISRVIININFQEETFDWVELSQLLKAWSVTEEQLVDACLLAGTEYCLTFPYLNLSQFHGRGQEFHFGTAVDFIKQAPLIGYMQHFPNEEMKIDHIDGYCVCKTLIQYPLALHFDGRVRAIQRRSIMFSSADDLINGESTSLSAGGLVERTMEEAAVSDGPGGGGRSSKAEDKKRDDVENSARGMVQSAPTFPPDVPLDFYKIVGLNLPSALFCLMAENFLSRKLPTVLALGEWLDYSHPTVDSVEYRDLLCDVREYRCRALGLVAIRLHEAFRQKSIRFSRYSCSPVGQQAPAAVVECRLACHPGMAWNFTQADLLAEMKRQKVTSISFKFCLLWHARSISLNRPLLSRDGLSDGPTVPLTDLLMIEAVVYFMLLENLGYFTPEGGVTVFGSALSASATEFEENVLFALELMKFGDLMGELLEAPPDRPFPPNIAVIKHSRNLPRQRQILLLSRVMSLISMKLKDSDLWFAPVDFDLAAFHSMVKILKRTLRHVTAACLANLLLKDMTRVKVVPHDAFDPQNPKFPSFLLPRNCMGIIVKHFLEFPTDALYAQSKTKSGAEAATKAAAISADSPSPASTALTSTAAPGCTDANSTPQQQQQQSTSSTAAGGNPASNAAGAHTSTASALCTGTTAGTAGASVVLSPGRGGLMEPVDVLRRLERELRKTFPCCLSPIDDMLKAFLFWREIVRVIDLLDQNIDVSDLKLDMTEAHNYLLQRIVMCGINLHPSFAAPEFADLRSEIAAFIAAFSPSNSATSLVAGSGGAQAVASGAAAFSGPTSAALETN